MYINSLLTRFGMRRWNFPMMFIYISNEVNSFEFMSLLLQIDDNIDDKNENNGYIILIILLFHYEKIISKEMFRVHL